MKPLLRHPAERRALAFMATYVLAGGVLWRCDLALAAALPFLPGLALPLVFDALRGFFAVVSAPLFPSTNSNAAELGVLLLIVGFGAATVSSSFPPHRQVWTPPRR